MPAERLQSNQVETESTSWAPRDRLGLDIDPSLAEAHAGFLTACSYVKPGRSVHEVETASVEKKLKDKAFARAVNRDDIVNGTAQLGVDLDQHISFCIEAMKARAAGVAIGPV